MIHGLEVGFHLRRGFFEIVGTDDVVAVENRAGLMAGDRHCHSFRDAGTNHVSQGRSPEIVEVPLTDLCFSKRRVP